MKLFLAQVNPTVGALEANRRLIMDAYRKGAEAGADLVVLSECVLTGYPVEDLVLRKEFMDAVQAEAAWIIRDVNSQFSGIQNGPGLLFGLPLPRCDGKVYNAAVLVEPNGTVQHTYKHELPNYGVFDERRTFASYPLENLKPMEFRGRKLGVMICEDMWWPNVNKKLSVEGAEILIVLNGSPFEADKQKIRYEHAAKRIQETGLNLIYVNQVGGQDELVFDGSSFCIGTDYDFTKVGDDREFPAIFHQMKRFEEDFRLIELEDNLGEGYQEDGPLGYPDDPVAVLEENTLETTYNALVLGLRDYVKKNGFPGVLLGVSGGVDSALVAAVAADAIGGENVLGVRLPSQYSSDHSLSDAADLCARLGMPMETVEIAPAFNVMEGNPTLKNLFASKGKTAFDITEENMQARLRGVYLMAISNKLGYMLLSTGNKSEVSVGYATLYGDMNGGYNPIKDCYKTTVFALCEWRNTNVPALSVNGKLEVIPQNIITKPPSAELRPDQKDSDSLPDYPVLDGILRAIVDKEKSVDETVKMGYDRDVILKVKRLVRIAEYKRRQACPGVKITGRLYGRDRRYPITNGYT
jgi:NAD+ synthase